MNRAFPWDVLEIAPTGDRKAIRSAYAARLKAIDPDEDVDGFSQLRAARDEALRLAQAGPPSAPVPPLSDDLSADLPATLSADLSADPFAMPGTPWQAQPDTAPVEDFAPDYGARPVPEDALRAPLGSGWDDAAGEVAAVDTDIGNPLGTPDVSGTGDVGLDSLQGDVAVDDAAAARLLEILFPENEYSDTALTPPEYEEALAHVRTVIAQAQAAAIDRQGGIEDWLAHYLASSWPRSGPLVQEAVDAFGWDREAGRIDEHAPVAFLNDRLRAHAFLEELEDPGHQWHKAYVELRKPGARSRLPWQRVKEDQVVGLLNHIRGTYPELEDYLDGARVASYVEPSDAGTTFGWVWFVVFGLFLAAKSISSFSPDPNRDHYTPPAPPVITPALMEDMRQQVIDELLGPGVNTSDLEQHAPNVSAILETVLSNGSSRPGNVTVATAMTRNVLRREMLVAAAHAPFEDLLAIKQFELNLLRDLRDSRGVDSCASPHTVFTGLDSQPVNADFVREERELARRLLDAGLLQPGSANFPSSATIPGDVVEEVMRRAGLSRSRFDAVSGGEGTAEEKCAYRIAMLEAILRRPGTVPAELLRIS